MILLATLVFTSPAGTLLTYVLWVGIGIIIAGIVRIVQGISTKGALDNWGGSVFEGVMDIFLGYILIVHPGLTLTILPVMIGFWAAFYGLNLIINAFTGSQNKVLKMVFGLLIIIISNIIIFNPISFGITMAIWLGVILFFAGIYNVIISFNIKSLPAE